MSEPTVHPAPGGRDPSTEDVAGGGSPPEDNPRFWSSWTRTRGSRLATWAWPGRPNRWRDVPSRLRPTLGTTTRLTAAAVVTYLITQVVTRGATDLTGTLTALLVVQTSAYATLKMGIVRVGAVLAGVLIASGLATHIGLSWWSLGAAIAASLLVAKVLRLGEQALEAPISAMLILGVTNAEVAAEIRVVNTLIGAGVGVLFNLVYPPSMPTRSAAASVVRVADAVAGPLDTAADDLAAGPVDRGQVEGWLDGLRTATRRLADANDTVARLRDSRRLNPRALGTMDVEPVLAEGLRTLEACLLATRSLFVVLRTERPAEDEQPGDPYSDELRAAFAVVLHDVADCIRGFGGLVQAEAEVREGGLEQALADSLEVLRETQAILAELLMVDARSNPAAWLLHGSVLAALEQVLLQLDLPTHERSHDAWRSQQENRPLAHLPPLIEGVLPHPDRNSPRGLPPLRLPPLRRPRPPAPPEGNHDDTP